MKLSWQIIWERLRQMLLNITGQMGPDSSLSKIHHKKNKASMLWIDYEMYYTQSAISTARTCNSKLCYKIICHILLYGNIFILIEIRIQTLSFQNSFANGVPFHFWMKTGKLLASNGRNIHVSGDNGQVRLGVRYVIIFLYVQFWIRLGTVSNCGKKVRTVDSPAVRSVNTSRDTRNCVQNEPKYAICVFVATLSYYKALGIILCALI